METCCFEMLPTIMTYGMWIALVLVSVIGFMLIREGVQTSKNKDSFDKEFRSAITDADAKKAKTILALADAQFLVSDRNRKIYQELIQGISA